MHVDSAIAFPGDGAADAVTNAQCPMSLPLAFAQGRQSIDCFPALADDKHEGVFVHWHVAVAKFAGELDLGRDMSEAFNQTFSDSRGMESSAASGDLVRSPQRRNHPDKRRLLCGPRS